MYLYKLLLGNETINYIVVFNVNSSMATEYNSTSCTTISGLSKGVGIITSQRSLICGSVFVRSWSQLRGSQLVVKEIFSVVATVGKPSVMLSYYWS